MKQFILDKEPKIESGFITPEHYFEDFSTNFLQNLPEKKPKVISIFRSVKIWSYASAAVFILGLSIPAYNHFKDNSAEIDNASLENYLAYHSTISENDFVNLLDEEDLKNIRIDLKVEDELLENELSTNANLEQYLLN